VKRSTWEGRSVVWRYGCPSTADLDETGLAQLRLAHALRNELVAIWRRHEAAVDATWMLDPEISRLATEESAAIDAQRAAQRALAAATSTTRSRRAGPAERAKLTAANRTVTRRHRELTAAKRDAFARIGPSFRTLHMAHEQSIKATYATFVKERGLYWGTYNLVANNHDRARNAVRNTRARPPATDAARPSSGPPRPAALCFARWRGEGSLAVQLQRSAADPPRTPALLASGASKWRGVLRLPWVGPEAWGATNAAERRKASRTTLAIRVGSGPGRSAVWLELPVLMHRPLPADADVTDVRVTRRRIAGHTRCSVELTVHLPRPATRSEGPIVGVNTGWRSMPDGSVRVATWRSDGYVTYAVDVSDPAWAAVGDGAGGEVRLPPTWVAGMAGVDEIRSRRARALHTMRVDIVATLGNAPDVARAWGLAPDDVARWRTPARFAALAVQVRSEPGPLPARLEAWRRRDARRWELEANLRDQLLARRNNAYRVIAAALARSFQTVVVEAPHKAKVTRQPARSQIRAARARGHAQLAASATFAAALANAVAARGGTSITVDPAGVSRIHHGCGGQLGAAEQPLSAVVTCPACGEAFDQDVNAALNLIERARTAPRHDGPVSTEAPPSFGHRQHHGT
jgi:hypothetical protein